jgi:RNA polymerase sigma-70 factor, ECF subfamily
MDHVIFPCLERRCSRVCETIRLDLLTWIRARNRAGDTVPDPFAIASCRDPALTVILRDEFHASLVAALPRLRALALAMTRNCPDAEDLVQDAVASALAARDIFEPSGHFSAWIYQIMRNRFVTVMRKRRPTSSMEEVPDAVISVAAPHEHRLVVHELARAFVRLPSDQREALVMAAIHNIGYAEIAAATGCAVGTAKSRVFRARRHLEALCGRPDIAPASRDPKPRSKPAARDKVVSRGSGTFLSTSGLEKVR